MKGITITSNLREVWTWERGVDKVARVIFRIDSYSNQS